MRAGSVGGVAERAAWRLGPERLLPTGYQNRSHMSASSCFCEDPHTFLGRLIISFVKTLWTIV